MSVLVVLKLTSKTELRPSFHSTPSNVSLVVTVAGEAAQRVQTAMLPSSQCTYSRGDKWHATVVKLYVMRSRHGSTTNDGRFCNNQIVPDVGALDVGPKQWHTHTRGKCHHT
jgi:hypothetical protein